MSVARIIRHELRLAAARIISRLPIEGERRPVFLVGCGRSGTTIIGTALSKHPRIAFLNERRHLWYAAYPESDIWTHRAAARGGRLVLTAEDADQQRSERLSRLFQFKALIARRPVVVEKLPVNAFRLEFLRGSSPKRGTCASIEMVWRLPGPSLPTRWERTGLARTSTSGESYRGTRGWGRNA